MSHLLGTDLQALLTLGGDGAARPTTQRRGNAPQATNDANENDAAGLDGAPRIVASLLLAS